MTRQISISFLSFFLAIFLSLAASAQLTDKVIEEVNGKRYYVHIVEKGHSLYAISRLYNSDIDTVIKANPEAAEGLSIGQRLRIPIEVDEKADLWSNPISIEDGNLVHRVKRRETLYSIAKEYNADMNEILELNPEANAGLKRGMELTIPVNDVEATFLPERKDKTEPHQKYHDVQPRETIYSISRKYGITADELIEANGGMPEGLKANSRIIIPLIPEENFTQRAGLDKPVEIDSKFKLELKSDAVYKKEYKVALLLPFFLGYEDSARFSVSQERLQQIAMEFYRGVKTGLDSMRTNGLSVELIVKDLHSDTPNVQQTLDKLSNQDVDLVIGPLQRSVFEKTAKHFKGSDTHVVCPVKQNNKVLLMHENLSKVVPSNVSQMDAIAAYVSDKFTGANHILVNSTFAKDARNVQLFRNSFNGHLGLADSLSPLKEVRVEENKTISGLETALDATKKNVIIAPTSNEVVVADLMRLLMTVKEMDYDIEVIGLDNWRGFYQTVNMEAREKYHVHLPSTQFDNDLDPVQKAFSRKFKNAYNVEAGKYAMLGYDIGRFYGKGLLQYGRNFPNRFADVDQTGLVQNEFSFVKTGVESGFENRHVFILAYRDYVLQKVTD